MAKDTMYNVKNRSAGVVVYRIPELNIRREFAPGETKRLSFDELEKLGYQPGGREMMANYLQIQNANVTRTLGIHTEPEYDMSERDIIDLIQNGSQDAFLDTLDFAPTAVIDLIKQYAVALPMMDIQKRQALKNKTGFDTDRALQHIAEERAEDAEGKTEQAAPTRRVKPATAPGRRSTLPQYNVVSKG